MYFIAILYGVQICFNTLNSPKMLHVVNGRVASKKVAGKRETSKGNIGYKEDTGYKSVANGLMEEEKVRSQKCAARPN